MLSVENLTTAFTADNQQILTAIDSISFKVPPKSTVGIVGESGSGKTVSALSILGLLPPQGRVQSGRIDWNGQDLAQFSEAQYRQIRGREIGLIFQNPLSALNPVFTIGNQFIETLQLHRGLSKKAARDEAIEWLSKVNIPDPQKRIDDYPHQFSLGMCQRLMIALTMAMRPKLLIADEPTASLDVTIGAQILLLLEQMKRELEMSVLIISHDLGVIAQHCDTIVVMYLGKVVEAGPTAEIFANPRHPYTQALIAAIPVPDPAFRKEQALLMGEVPSLYNLPKGCRFHTRCPKAFDRCKIEIPPMYRCDQVDVACFLYDK